MIKVVNLKYSTKGRIETVCVINNMGHVLIIVWKYVRILDNELGTNLTFFIPSAVIKVID